MAGQVTWTETAWSDLENAADYIAKDSAYYAATFVSEAREAARSLSQFAGRGRMVPEFQDSNIRELFVGNYRMIYKIAGNRIYIIGFIHGARNLWKLWEKESR